MLNLEKIYQAKERIQDIVVNTPFAYAPFLSQLSDSEVHLKLEELIIK